MTTPSKPSNSAPRIAHCLRGYSLSLEHWVPDMAETAAEVGLRRALHESLAELTPPQREQLAQLDAKAAALYARHRGQPDPYSDIRGLGEMVAIAQSERPAAAA